jgi:subtilisin family serine protease
MKKGNSIENESLKNKGWEESSLSKISPSLKKKISENISIGNETSMDVIIQVKPSNKVENMLSESAQSSMETNQPLIENFKKATFSDENLNEVYNYVSSVVKSQPSLKEINVNQEIEKNTFANSIRISITPKQVQEISKNNKISHIETNDALVPEMQKNMEIIHIANARRIKNHPLSGKNIKVGIIDSEIDDSHKSLKNIKITKTNLSNDPLGNPSVHGTHVAGIIASSDSEFMGIAPDVSIHNFKVFPDGKKFEGIKAIELAVSERCHILNLSFGVTVDRLDGSSAICTAVDNAVKLGICVVKSAGNNGPMGMSSITSPSDAKEVLSVGSVNSDGNDVAWYSSQGPSADGRAVPHICAPGEEIMSTIPGNEFGVDTGTSMSAPHVSGIIALMLEANPNLTPQQIKEILVETAQKNLYTSDPNIVGAGLVDAEKAILKALNLNESIEI